MTPHRPFRVFRGQDAWTILAAAVLCALAVLAINYNGRKEYEATVRVNVAPVRFDLGTTQAVRDLLGNYASGIESVDFARQVFAKAGFSAPSQPESGVQATAEPEELLIYVSATHPDPLAARLLAQTAAALFVEERAAFNMARERQDRIDVSVLDVTPIVMVAPMRPKLIVGALATGLLCAAGVTLVLLLRRRLRAKTI